MKMIVDDGATYKLSVQDQSAIPVSMDTAVVVNALPYTGDYTITPSGEAQTLETKGFRMTENITIEPIPSNYGLITWNGSTLTVS